MSVDTVLARLTVLQHNLYIHSYPNDQALFRILVGVRSAGCPAPELRVRQRLPDP